MKDVNCTSVFGLVGFRTSLGVFRRLCAIWHVLPKYSKISEIFEATAHRKLGYFIQLNAA